MPMTMGPERWQLPILVSEEQEMVDGSQDTQTKAQKLAHLRGLITAWRRLRWWTWTAQAYDVKWSAPTAACASMRCAGYGDAVVDWIITMSLEQVQ